MYNFTFVSENQLAEMHTLSCLIMTNLNCPLDVYATTNWATEIYEININRICLW